MRLAEIIPEMKVAALLDHFPELENALVEMAPEFRKLKNPFLKKTIARITTLKQAAAIANLPVETLVNRLRLMAGQPILEGFEINADDFEGTQPGWLTTKDPVKTFDATEIIRTGGMPLGQIMDDLEGLPEGEIYLLITPMLPVPLLEKARDKGYRTWSEKVNDHRYDNWLMG